MTAPAPKQIEDCPNPECKHFCAMYEAPFVSNDGLMHKVKCDDCGYMGPWARTSDEAIRLHNLLCRPQQSAEPVATVGANGKPVVHAGTCLMTGAKLYLASPGPSELVEEMEAIVKELEYVEFSSWQPYREDAKEDKAVYWRDVQEFVDKLRALITRHRGKS